MRVTTVPTGYWQSNVSPLCQQATDSQTCRHCVNRLLTVKCVATVRTGYSAQRVNRHCANRLMTARCIDSLALLGCYAAMIGSYRRFSHFQGSKKSQDDWNDRCFETSLTINERSVTSQKSEDLIYNVSHHAQPNISTMSPSPCPLQGHKRPVDSPPRA